MSENPRDAFQGARAELEQRLTDEVAMLTKSIDDMERSSLAELEEMQRRIGAFKGQFAQLRLEIERAIAEARDELEQAKLLTRAGLEEAE